MIISIGLMRMEMRLKLLRKLTDTSIAVNAIL